MTMLLTNAAAGASGPKTYVDDVFSTYLYTGNGSTQTITNGIDLAGKGGMVWIKGRSGATTHLLTDTVRGATKRLGSDTTSAENTDNTGLTSFSASGFSIGSSANYNTNTALYTSWTFRKAPKFFDVVTYTGNGTNRTIAHSLGQVPGMIVVKRTDTTGNWGVYHRSVGNNQYLLLNSTAAQSSGPGNSDWWNNTTPTESVFSLGTNVDVNANGGTYVAYLFAHDTATDGLIQCGSFTTDVSSNATVNLGWEPQFVLVKQSSTTGNWVMFDQMRGMLASTQGPTLFPNTTGAEGIAGGTLYPAATGFAYNQAASTTYIYIAIRRPNKPPTSGTQVFMPTVYTGTNVDNQLVDTTIAPDMVMARQRNSTTVAGMVVGDRLRGQLYLLTGATDAEKNDIDSLDQQIVSTTEYGTAFSSMTGIWVGNDAASQLNANTTANNHIAEAFKRAPGFFDVVCYTGTNSVLNVPHSLGVAPELMIVRNRNVSNTIVYAAALGASATLSLNTNVAVSTSDTTWNNTAPTATQFTLGTSNGNVNTNGQIAVAYLFASLPGISKVGSYTGNGGTQTINCGFTGGARFVLIKRTDNTGDWYVWDTARGIVAGNDPHLSLNSTAAEVTTNDSIDTDNTGFVVNQLAATNINVNSATYIYLAIA